MEKFGIPAAEPLHEINVLQIVSIDPPFMGVNQPPVPQQISGEEFHVSSAARRSYGYHAVAVKHLYLDTMMARRCALPGSQSSFHISPRKTDWSKRLEAIRPFGLQITIRGKPNNALPRTCSCWRLGAGIVTWFCTDGAIPITQQIDN
jgi:hypothetical protein